MIWHFHVTPIPLRCISIQMRLSIGSGKFSALGWSGTSVVSEMRPTFPMGNSTLRNSIQVHILLMRRYVEVRHIRGPRFTMA